MNHSLISGPPNFRFDDFEKVLFTKRIKLFPSLQIYD